MITILQTIQSNLMRINGRMHSFLPYVLQNRIQIEESPVPVKQKENFLKL